MPDRDAVLTRYLFDHARDIVLVIDASTGQILDANFAAALAYQYTREELLKLRIFDLRVDSPDSVSDQMSVANRDGILFETVHRRRDGTVFPVEVSSQTYPSAESPRLFSIIRDISERVRIDHERAALLAQTQRMLALRDEFLDIASHELRAPITNVSLQLQHQLRALDRGATSPQLRTGAEAALREAKRLSDLVDKLLDAQAARGHVPIDASEFDLAEVVVETVQTFRIRAEQAGIELAVDLQPTRGRWDRLRIDQVISNLVSNAIKYGGANPVTVSVRELNGEAVLEVRDRGIGLRTDDIELIFERFARAVPANYGGFGLGLYITRRAVEAHGGAITVDSTLGAGSTFRVTLPMRVA